MQEITANRIITRTRSMLESVPYVVLATADGSTVSARQVQPLTVTDDLTIWVGTSPRSRKVRHVAATSQATVVVEDFNAFAYASLLCDATIVDDPVERSEHWTEGLAAFFPGGPRGDDFVLLRLTPRVIEVMDFSADVTPAPYGLAPAVVERTENRWILVPHDAQNDSAAGRPGTA